jgi:hypothetical protein
MIDWWENDLPDYKFGVYNLNPIKVFENLEDLAVRSPQLRDISAISNLTKINRLLCQYSKVHNWSPISSLTNLKELDISWSTVNNLDFLKNIRKLRSLYIFGTNISKVKIMQFIKENPWCEVYSDYENLDKKTNMEQLVKHVHQIIKDYRKDDGIGISEQRITNWINQFSENNRVFILTELKHVMDKMYFSKDRVKRFLKDNVENLRNKFGYSTFKDLLDNTNFLDLQRAGKSQKKILELLHEVLKDDFEYDYKNLGSNSQKHNIYIDDVLCTGNTFYYNLKDWVTENGKDRLAKLKSKQIDLTIFYMFIADKYYRKKRGQFYHRVSQDFTNFINVSSIYWFKDEILKPVASDVPETIKEYREKVENQANEHAENKGFSSYSPDFYRSKTNPEEFYSSIENRKRLELIFLEKGIEILNNSNVSKTNIRPLGFSLPAYKDFGFGALIFTWRNIANNTPLVFWYSSKDFTPLFVNKR